MSEAAPAARCGVAVAAKEEEQRVAAELEDVAAVPLGDLDQAVEAARDPRTSSSAPALPLDGSRSASAVNPEMSTETREPCSTRKRAAVRLRAPGVDEPREVGGERRVGPLRLGAACNRGRVHAIIMRGSRLYPL